MIFKRKQVSREGGNAARVQGHNSLRSDRPAPLSGSHSSPQGIGQLVEFSSAITDMDALTGRSHPSFNQTNGAI